MTEDSQSDEPRGNGEYGPFAYLNAPNRTVYRRVMRAMMTQKERFTVHVRPEEVHAALAADASDEMLEESVVAEALDRLASPAWGNLLAFPDASRVSSVEDFYRRRMIYQLSRPGEAAERALAQYDSALGSRGALQSVALEDIVALLTSLRAAAVAHEGGEQIDRAVLHQNLRSLRERFVELAENAVAFMGSMQRTIDLHDADVEAFLAYKEELISYLERFIADLLTRGAQIAELLAEMTPPRVEFLAGVAAERESADSAPGEAETARDDVRRTWLRRWSGLAEWFVSTPARESEAKLLRARARTAIPALLAVVRALHEKAGGRSDRTQDFLALAAWFAELPTDGDRHRLWRSAFGLTPARHLTLTPATQEAWQEADLGNATPWQEAPPVEISPQLRKSGSYERRGKPTRVADRTAAKQMLAAAARAETEQTAAARARILTHGPRPLSEFGELDPDAFRLFLALLGDALGAMGPADDAAEVYTSDGELRVTLTRIPGARETSLSTPDGVLRGPDHVVDIASVHAESTQEAYA